MIRLTLLVVPLLLSFYSPLSAQISNPKATFTAMCIVEKSTGFNWVNGGWQAVNFKAEKYIIERLLAEEVSYSSPNFQHPKSGLCKPQLDESRHPADAVIEKHGFAYGCYNVRRMGEPFNYLGSSLCGERWAGSGENQVLQSVMCMSHPWQHTLWSETIAFAPDGWFHRAVVHGDLRSRAKDGEKESLVLEVGKCAVVSK